MVGQFHSHFLFAVCKIKKTLIYLEGKLITPCQGGYRPFLFSFQLLIPSSQSRTLEELFEQNWSPLTALNLALQIAS